PVYCFPTRSLRAFAICVAFLHSDYYALFDFPMWPWSFVGLSLTYFPPSFTSTMGSPVFTMEDSSEILEVACFWVPLPRFAASECCHRVSQVDLCNLWQFDWSELPRSVLPLLRPCFWLHWLT